MENWGFGSYFLTSIFVIVIIYNPIKNWWFNKLITKAIDLKKICEIAEIKEKDLNFSIVSTYRTRSESLTGRLFVLHFSYFYPKAFEGTSQKNKSFSVGGDVTIETNRPVNHAIQKLIEDIKNIKSGKYSINKNGKNNAHRDE